MLLNCGVREDSWESLGLQGNPTSLSERKSVLNIHWKDWCWSWNSNTLATWCEELTHWKRPWCWERFKAGGEGDKRGWDGWMASLTQWTQVWVNSRSWQWTGRPGMLQSMGSQRVGHNWVTELNWTDKEELTICGPKSLVFKGSQNGDVFILLSSSLDTHFIVQAHSICKCWHLLSNWKVSAFSFSQVLKLPKALLSFKALLKSSLLNRHRPSHHFPS